MELGEMGGAASPEKWGCCTFEVERKVERRFNVKLNVNGGCCIAGEMGGAAHLRLNVKLNVGST